MKLDSLRCLNGNALKIIAAVLMAIDHAGLLLAPYGSQLYMVMRILGRIAMPLFAYMIAEGCRYTKNKINHFAMIFGLGMLCSLVYYFVDEGSLDLCILVTFSFSVPTIYALQHLKKCFLLPGARGEDKFLSVVLFLSMIVCTYFFCRVLPDRVSSYNVDYGFWGAMLPVFVSIFDFRGIPLPKKWAWLDGYLLRVLALGIGIVCLCYFNSTSIEWYALLALPLLVLYNGKKGKLNLKYFFYIFYPVHLVVLAGIAFLMYSL